MLIPLTVSRSLHLTFFVCTWLSIFGISLVSFRTDHLISIFDTVSFCILGLSLDCNIVGGIFWWNSTISFNNYGYYSYFSIHKQQINLLQLTTRLMNKYLSLSLYTLLGHTLTLQFRMNFVRMTTLVHWPKTWRQFIINNDEIISTTPNVLSWTISLINWHEGIITACDVLISFYRQNVQQSQYTAGSFPAQSAINSSNAPPLLIWLSQMLWGISPEK